MNLVHIPNLMVENARKIKNVRISYKNVTIVMIIFVNLQPTIVLFRNL